MGCPRRRVTALKSASVIAVQVIAMNSLVSGQFAGMKKRAVGVRMGGLTGDGGVGGGVGIGVVNPGIDGCVDATSDSELSSSGSPVTGSV